MDCAFTINPFTLCDMKVAHALARNTVAWYDTSMLALLASAVSNEYTSFAAIQVLKKKQTTGADKCVTYCSSFCLCKMNTLSHPHTIHSSQLGCLFCCMSCRVSCKSNLSYYTGALQKRLSWNCHEAKHASDSTACAVIYASLTPLDMPNVCVSHSTWHLMCLQESSF